MAILALAYDRATGAELPLGTVAGLYARRIGFVREQYTRDGRLSPEDFQVLGEITADLEVLVGACRPEALVGRRAGEVSAWYAGVAPRLKLAEARDYQK